MPTTAGAAFTWLGSSGVAAAAATAVAGAVASKALAPKQVAQKVDPLSLVDKPQKTQEAIDPQTLAKKNALAASATGALSGNSGTWLSGSNGVSPANLSLGSTSLLGE